MSLRHEGHYGKLNVPIETPDGRFLYLAYKIEDGAHDPIDAWLVSDQNSYVRETDRTLIERWAGFIIKLLAIRWDSVGKPLSYIEEKIAMIEEAFKRQKIGLRIVQVPVKVEDDVTKRWNNTSAGEVSIDPTDAIEQATNEIIKLPEPEPLTLEAMDAMTKEQLIGHMVTHNVEGWTAKMNKGLLIELIVDNYESGITLTEADADPGFAEDLEEEPTKEDKSE